MSYLSKPRIGFFSADAMANPSTANNEYIAHLLDYDRVRLLNPPEVAGSDLQAMSDGAYRDWMTALLSYAEGDANSSLTGSLSEPAWQFGVPAFWNYFGDHSATFGGATVTSCWLHDVPVTDPTADPLIGARVILDARMVDLNPADTYCTQIVGANFSLIGRNSRGQSVELLRGLPSTAVTRWLNGSRIHGAGTFQAVIPNDKLIFSEEQGFPSPGLEALRSGARVEGGLLLRWCLYGMALQVDALTMYDRLRRGEHASNPKLGRVVGSLGVWTGTDMKSAPVGRVLRRPQPNTPSETTPSSPTPPRRKVKTHEDLERVAPNGTAGSGNDRSTSPAPGMGTAAAVVVGNTIMLDLITAFPEAASSENPWDKYSFGPVDLELVYEGEDGLVTTTIGTVNYARSYYEQMGGVCEVTFDVNSDLAGHIGHGALQLSVRGTDITLLREVDDVQILTDDHAVYLGLEKTAGRPAAATANIALRFFRRGEINDQKTDLRLELWRDRLTAGRADSVSPLVVSGPFIDEVRYREQTVSINTLDGVETISVIFDEPGCYKLRYMPSEVEHDEDNPNWFVEPFSLVRVLPDDDYCGLSEADITFDYVYNEVLRYYALLYPVMSDLIPWGPANTPHDNVRVTQFATLIREVIDVRHRGTALEMPITRELSAGKRSLLQRWCDLQLRDDNGSSPGEG